MMRRVERRHRIHCLEHFAIHQRRPEFGSARLNDRWMIRKTRQQRGPGRNARRISGGVVTSLETRICTHTRELLPSCTR